MFFIPYIHCNFFARCKKRIIFLLEIRLSPLRQFFLAMRVKHKKVLYIYKEYEKLIKLSEKKVTHCKN